MIHTLECSLANGQTAVWFIYHKICAVSMSSAAHLDIVPAVAAVHEISQTPSQLIISL